MTLTDLIVLSLAVWRVTSIVRSEDIAAPVRKLFGIYEEESFIVYPDTFIGNLLKCFWCTSVWGAAACVVLYYVFMPALYIFAASAAAIIIQHRVLGGT